MKEENLAFKCYKIYMFYLRIYHRSWAGCNICICVLHWKDMQIAVWVTYPSCVTNV